MILAMPSHKISAQHSIGIFEQRRREVSARRSTWASFMTAGAAYQKNRSIAINWYKLAAEKGYGRAAYDLGVIYRDGDGVRRDVSASIHYFRLAEAVGIKAARQNLAMLQSHSVPKAAIEPVRPRPPPGPFETAVEHDNFERFQTAALERANIDSTAAVTFANMIPSITREANSGNQLAQYDLGFAYERGIGVVKDTVKSYVFYMRASFSADDENVKLAARQGGIDVGVLLTTAEYQAALSMLFDNHE
jgi:TPR repeat protein